MRKEFKTIQVDADLKSRIEFLTKSCGCNSQNEFLNEVINPLFDVACNFSYGGFESFPLFTKSCVHYQFYPKVAMVRYGANIPIEEQYDD